MYVMCILYIHVYRIYLSDMPSCAHLQLWGTRAYLGFNLTMTINSADWRIKLNVFAIIR